MKTKYLTVVQVAQQKKMTTMNVYKLIREKKLTVVDDPDKKKEVNGKRGKYLIVKDKKYNSLNRPIQEGFLSLTDAAKEKGVKYNTFYGWVKKGLVDTQKEGKEVLVVINEKYAKILPRQVNPDKTKGKKISITLAAKIKGVSRQTIYDWRDKKCIRIVQAEIKGRLVDTVLVNEKFQAIKATQERTTRRDREEELIKRVTHLEEKVARLQKKTPM